MKPLIPTHRCRGAAAAGIDANAAARVIAPLNSMVSSSKIHIKVEVLLLLFLRNAPGATCRHHGHSARGYMCLVSRLPRHEHGLHPGGLLSRQAQGHVACPASMPLSSQLPSLKWRKNYSLARMCLTRSTIRLLYPISLSYQLITFTNVGVSAIPAFASKMEERLSPMKSVDTSISSV